jgi:hypothetical protein
MRVNLAYYTQNYWVFGFFPSSGILENTTFRKWICFHPQVKVGEKTPTQLGPLERANLSHWTSVTHHRQNRLESIWDTTVSLHTYNEIIVKLRKKLTHLIQQSLTHYL